jgi:hypothetical protein
MFGKDCGWGVHAALGRTIDIAVGVLPLRAQLTQA